MKKRFTNSELRLYEAISRATQADLLGWLEKYLVSEYSEERVIATSDFLYAVGDIPVMLVAHLDTVHLQPPSEIFYDRVKNVLWSPEGLGADDRAGVYAIMDILRDDSIMRPHVLFTTDEEKGGLGAQAAASLLDAPDVNFIIGLDRKGEDDSVYYGCDNPDFTKYINKYGFKTQTGSFSDISFLCPTWGIAGVNLSIGYVDEHTGLERLYVSHMMSTIEKVKTILRELDHKKDKFKYIPSKVAFGSYGTYSWSEDGRDLVYFSDEICYECFNAFKREFVVDMGSEGKFCSSCYATLFSTCKKCERPFKNMTGSFTECFDCRRGDN